MDKKMDLPEEYLQLGRYLWERVKKSDPKEKETQSALSRITHALIDTCDDEGFMHNLHLWAGEQRDTGKSWYESYDDMPQTWPEFFRKSPPNEEASHGLAGAVAHRSSLPKEYLRLGRYLWDRIDQSDPKDYESIKVLSLAISSFVRTWDDDGFMDGLGMWIDVRKDTGEPWDDSGLELKEAYPEFFNV